ncbi:hypothetical protein lbkm_1014 [Lachnospiraceae bacterium KM106-2]|nr:hypothetical protein lbkm_1014 [Lachnospiraceae bacterium KM106-2]
MKARLKFNKAGSMKFIGHLDIMRYFQKAFRRAGIDVAYSQGYSPHQLISFAAPLGVGLTSDGEYLDMQLNSTLPADEMLRLINEQLNEEIQVTSIKALSDESKNAMSIVAGADYKVSVKDGYYVCDDFTAKFAEFLANDNITIVKKTKKSEKEMDIKPFIYHHAFTLAEFNQEVGRNYEISVADEYENGAFVYMQLSTGSVDNLKPELVMDAFCQSIGVEYNKFAYQVHRMELYANDVTKEELEQGKRNLVPLEELGHELI